MAAPVPVYELVLLLDPRSEDSQRERVLDDVQRTIEAGGTLVDSRQWGTRAMAYEVGHQRDAEYHLIQFEAPRATIEALDRALHISDGVVRYRVIKVPPGAPPPKPLVTAAAPQPVAAER